MASSNLAGPGSNPGEPAFLHDRRGPERLGYLGDPGSSDFPERFESAPDRTHDRDFHRDVPPRCGRGVGG